jgi:hypothetical protein
VRIENAHHARELNTVESTREPRAVIVEMEIARVGVTEGAVGFVGGRAGE